MYNGFGNALQFLAILAFMVDDHLKLITFIWVGNIFRIVVFTVALFLTFKAMNEKTCRVKREKKKQFLPFLLCGKIYCIVHRNIL